MKKISTGEDSTLKTYRSIAYIIGGLKESDATDFIDKKILTSKNGENEEVVADESQMLMFLTNLAQRKRVL